MKPVTSLYLHFPFCKHLCNYCDFYKHKLESKSQIVAYEAQLSEQIDLHCDYLRGKGFQVEKLESLYIGGGTPSLWGRSGAIYLKERFSLQENCEFTIEVDPDAWSEEEIDHWLSIGVNRFSIGVQAFSSDYLTVMDRTHTLSNVEKTIKYFSERKLNFSVDLMLGLPNVSARNLRQELDDLLKYSPNHFSVYILKTRKNYPHNRLIPNDEVVRSEYLFVAEYLKKQGYDHYEVSNFAKKGFKSRHNLKYWSYESVAGIGPNATGLLVSKDHAIRYQWKNQALGVIEEILKDESLIIEKLFLGLRHHCNFNITNIFTEKKQLASMKQLVEVWKKLKYIDEDSSVSCLNLTELGFLMCDSLLDDIFREVKF